MGSRRRYVKRDTTIVAAVRVDLETEGFTYQKWGHEQRCKPGDWILDNGGEVYTVDATTFEETYVRVGIGQYRKTAPVWAQQAVAPGVVTTKEGKTAYQAGDYLVSNRADGTDGYAVSRERFEAMYIERDAAGKSD